MKKMIFRLAAVAALTFPSVAFGAGSITEIWKYTTADLNSDWDRDAPDWSPSAAAVKSQSCARFATAADGKVYTVNMKTMSIAEISADGWRDLYRLPVPDDASDYYGTALSADQAGNFLVGHYFTNVQKSSIVWSVYCPASGESHRLELSVPDDYQAVVDGKTYSGVGRIDCVGRVLGDLSREAVFFIAPAFGNAAPFVRMVRLSYDGTGSPVVDATPSPALRHKTSSSSLSIAQPKDASFAAFAGRSNPESGFIMYVNAGRGATDYCSFADDGTFDEALFSNSALNSVTAASTGGFDTFVIDGVRYFVVNYLSEYDGKNCNTMDIAVVRADGSVVAQWQKPDYASQYGYSSIIAEPLADGTANIYVYNSTNADGTYGRRACAAAAMLNFDPKKTAEPDPDVRPGSSEDNPIVISSADDLLSLGSKLVNGDNFISLANDIDMSGIEWRVLCPEGSRAKIHLDGCCHIIRNLRPLSSPGQNGSLIGYFSGSVKNLGIEDVTVSNSWYCVGAIAGIAVDATIDNCFVTGSVTGAASGALVGCNKGQLTVTNCYSFADVADKTGAAEYSGGLVGRSDAPLSVSYSYAACTVTSTGGHAGGIVTVQRSTSVKLDHVIAWNMAVDGKTLADPICAGNAAVTNSFYWDAMELNRKSVTGGLSFDQLRDEVATWDAFSLGKIKIVTEFPALNWEERFATSSVDDIVTDCDCAGSEPVYYNLQGIRVTTPGSGIYIERRGKTVRKVIL